MARLFQSGAEISVISPSQSLGLDPDADIVGAAGQTRDTTVFRSGVASWKFDSTVSNTLAYRNSTLNTFVDGTTYFSRVYVRATAAPGAAVQISFLGTINNIGARFRTDGAVELVVNNAAQGSPSASIADSSWHRIELSGVATATTTWTAAELRVDGASVATWSGSLARAGSFFNWGWTAAPGASQILNIDDVALNDSTGAANNTWCGDGKVVLLSPTADSAVGTGWTRDNAGTTGLFNAVKNTPPAGVADTTAGTGNAQIRNATSNANVNYDATMTTYTAAGIGATDTVNAVVPWVATAAPVVTSAKAGTVGVVSNPVITNVNLGPTGTAGAFWAGVAAGTYGAGWKWSPGTVANAPTVTRGTAPVMRVTQVDASTRIAMVCGMFMYVDYTPAVATAVIPDVGMALTVT